MIQPTPNPTGAPMGAVSISVVGSLLSSPPARRNALFSDPLPGSHELVASCNRTRSPLLLRDHRTLVLHRAPRVRDDPVGAPRPRPCAGLRQGILAAALAEQLHFSTAITRIGAINFTTTTSPPW